MQINRVIHRSVFSLSVVEQVIFCHTKRKGGLPTYGILSRLTCPTVNALGPCKKKGLG